MLTKAVNLTSALKVLNYNRFVKRFNKYFPKGVKIPTWDSTPKSLGAKVRNIVKKIMTRYKYPINILKHRYSRYSPNNITLSIECNFPDEWINNERHRSFVDDKINKFDRDKKLSLLFTKYNIDRKDLHILAYGSRGISTEVKVCTSQHSDRRSYTDRTLVIINDNFENQIINFCDFCNEFVEYIIQLNAKYVKGKLSTLKKNAGRQKEFYQIDQHTIKNAEEIINNIIQSSEDRSMEEVPRTFIEPSEPTVARVSPAANESVQALYDRIHERRRENG